VIGRRAAVLAASILVLLGAATPAIADYAEINQFRMYYEIRGKGPVLVLLHGGAGNGMQFEKQIPVLERHYRLVIPDMRAQGRSGDNDYPLTYHGMAEDVNVLMSRLGVQRFDVMGWSDGGICGIDLAIHHASRVNHLITFGANYSTAGMQAQDAAWVDTATAAAFGPEMRVGWMALSPEPGNYDVAMTKILRMWKNEPNFSMKQLGSIRAKTMICAGEHDLVRREHTEALAKAIPKATLWIVPGASHGAIQEKPEEVNAKVLEFLAH